MRAVELADSGLVVRDDYPEPNLVAGESIVRVSLAGICSTDLELVKGYFGFSGILGHEFVGVVEQSDRPLWIGQRVVSTINFADPHSSEFATFGNEHHPHRSVLGILNRDGAMADYVAVPTRNLIAVPDDVSDRRAVFTEPLAAALRIADQMAVRPSANIAVIGAGRLGMLIGKVLSLHGANVQMLARRSNSLALANDWGLAARLVESAPDDSMDLVVEATGNPAGLAQALRLVKPLGMIVLKSTYAGSANVDLTKVVVGEVSVIGSRCGPFPPALRLLQAGVMDVESMIDAQYSINDAVDAFTLAQQPGIRKVLLTMA